MPRKVPYGEKVSVLKTELRKLRNEGLVPISKMKKAEVITEIDIRRQKKRQNVVGALREIEKQVAGRNLQRKKDADEVKGAMNYMKDTLELEDMVNKLNTRKRPTKKTSMPFSL